MIRYEQLLNAFYQKGYQCSEFEERPDPEGRLLLRHDIDFDVKLAGEMAELEQRLAIKATYFFMLRSKSYNLFDPENAQTVKRIQDHGHTVSLHFDPTIYNDHTEGLRKERTIFEEFFKTRIDCISIHRPLEEFLNGKSPIPGLRHTYQPVYFTQIKYFADSQGLFRYGDPLHSVEFSEKRTIQLLIHPIWWVTDEEDPIRILNSFLNGRIRTYQEHMARNCKPYQEYLREHL